MKTLPPRRSWAPGSVIGMHWETMASTSKGLAKSTFPWAEPEDGEPPASRLPFQVVPGLASHPLKPKSKLGLAIRLCAAAGAARSNATAGARRKRCCMRDPPSCLVDMLDQHFCFRKRRRFQASRPMPSGHAPAPPTLRQRTGPTVEGPRALREPAEKSANFPEFAATRLMLRQSPQSCRKLRGDRGDSPSSPQTKLTLRQLGELCGNGGSVAAN